MPTQKVFSTHKLDAAVIAELVRMHGTSARKDIRSGVQHCRRVWKGSNKAFHAFCVEHYVPPGPKKRQLLTTCDRVLGSLGGYFGMMSKQLSMGAEVADSPLTPADRVFAAFSPSSHFGEDLQKGGVGPLIQLNFGTEDITPPRTRDGWAARRLSLEGAEVVPAQILFQAEAAVSRASDFVSSFNLPVDRIQFPDPKIKFPPGTFLMSHWGLRDHMTALASDPASLPKQRAIRGLMQRVVDGEIPAQILNNKDAAWSIPSGTVTVKGRTEQARMIGDLRWRHFSGAFGAIRAADPYLRHGDMVRQKFLGEREMPESQVVGLLKSILSAPEAVGVGEFISQRLGRPLEAHDIYWDNFFPDGSTGTARVDSSVARRFKNAAGLQRAIPDILVEIGFSRKQGEWIGSKIQVHNGRSAGHAVPPCSPEDLQFIRVPASPGKISAQDFSTFMHELGHAVEMVLTTYNLDYRSLWGVPSTGFSEAFAFTFQDKVDLVLGKAATRDPNVETLFRFWEAYEIAGPALTEIEFFHWLYAHPKASPSEMQRAIRKIGDSIWDRYYARVLGRDGFGLMSVYSHILTSSFYLADYPLGYIIAYQVRRHLRNKNLAREMERMCSMGDVYPDVWMKNAVGSSVSTEPLLRDTARALRSILP